MSEVTIYHNPRCSKSRQTLQLLGDKGVDPKIVEYLAEPPSREELKRILGMLGISAAQLVRSKETAYKELGLGENSTERELIDAMAENPILIERPIVINGDRARLGRPPESVVEIL